MDPNRVGDEEQGSGNGNPTDPSASSAAYPPPQKPLPQPPQTAGEQPGVTKPKVAFVRPPSLPAVIWNDKRSMEASPHQTFYSEGTPPPSPSDFRSNISSAGGGGMSGDYVGYHAKPTPRLDRPYDYSYDHVAPPAPLPQDDKWFTPKKRVFWIVIAAVLLLIVIAVAVGVGVGVSQQKSSSGGNSDSASNPSTTSSSDAPSSTAESDSPSTTSSGPPETTSSGSSTGACPAANNTVFEVPNSDKTFLRLCGVDYPGGSNAEDLTTVWTASMVDCITNCAGFPQCEACSWGALAGDKGDNHRCYLKRALKKAKPVREGWDFAILQDGG